MGTFPFPLVDCSPSGSAHARHRQPGRGAPSTQSSMEKSIGAAFDDVYARYRLPGLALGVVRDGKVTYTRTAGETSAGSGETIDSRTLFKIASNSKAMTTGVLARLVDAGKLRWDDPVTALPAAVPHVRPVGHARVAGARPALAQQRAARRRGRSDVVARAESVYACGRHCGARASQAAAQLSLALRLRQPDVRRRGRSRRCGSGYVVRRARATGAVRAAADDPLPGRAGSSATASATSRSLTCAMAIAMSSSAKIPRRFRSACPAAAGGIRCSLDDMLKWVRMWLDPDSQWLTPRAA